MNPKSRGTGQMGQFQGRPDEAPPATRRGSTAAQLKHDIDSGRTGDKVNFPDPAAAPLGTDDEAGGVSHSPEQIHEMRLAESSRPLDAPGADSRGNPGGAETRDATGHTARWLTYLVVAIAIGVIIYLFTNV
ncbi:hypothetical protein [Pedomonas mirosovicensis]|uniref:hypothetical protein n=1 Tax=Pedomonas mirosovicensis TaxID=2908641 RepID=UPI002169E4D4|nr:hypothetical protein [Pedomonas mirosovicensis]MCH8686039.1 hypothetical protein [Pedomonas mirosovicensis]